MASLTPPPSCTLFVGNLQWGVEDGDLLAYLSTAGTVVSCKVQRHVDTGRSKGWALCRYSSPAEAAFAISQFDQREFGQRQLSVRLDRSDADSVASAKLYVGNIPFEATDEEVQDIFAAFRPIDARVQRAPNGRSRGFAIVRFKDVELAEQAKMQLNGYDLDGRALEVREDRGRAPRHRGARAEGEGNTDQKTASMAPSRCLFVSNLSYDTTDSAFLDFFTMEGGATPISAQVQMNETNGRSKGWGLVVYATIDEAEIALSRVNRADLNGRPIAVRFDARVNSKPGLDAGPGHGIHA